MSADSPSAGAAGGLTAAQIALVEQSNAANILKKLKAGKTLTKYERETLQAAASSPDPQPGWAKLALQLHVSRPTLTSWRKLAGAPKAADFSAWKIFVETEALGVAGNRVGKEREAHLTSAVAKRNRLLDLEIAQKEGRMADRGEVNEMLTRVGSLQKTILYAKLERELPAKAVGRSAEEIAALGREFADELADIFARGLEEWQDGQ